LAVAAMSFFALTSQAQAEDKGLVGISMPTKSSARWIDDGNNLVKTLQGMGYTTDLQYADDDIPNQLAQIENMVTKGVKVLVIAAIDGTTLSDVLGKAHDAGIKVIAYDRLIKKSPNVDYYATFDNFKVGVLQARVRSTSSCSAVRRTTTTPSSSMTARCRSCSPTSTARSWWCSPARPAWTRSARCAGTAPWRRPAWTTCSRPTTPTSASMRCSRRMTASRSVSFPR
jgi:hypothetical protein